MSEILPVLRQQLALVLEVQRRLDLIDIDSLRNGLDRLQANLQRVPPLVEPEEEPEAPPGTPGPPPPPPPGPCQGSLTVRSGIPCLPTSKSHLKVTRLQDGVVIYDNFMPLFAIFPGRGKPTPYSTDLLIEVTHPTFGTATETVAWTCGQVLVVNLPLEPPATFPIWINVTGACLQYVGDPGGASWPAGCSVRLQRFADPTDPDGTVLWEAVATSSRVTIPSGGFDLEVARFDIPWEHVAAGTISLRARVESVGSPIGYTGGDWSYSNVNICNFVYRYQDHTTEAIVTTMPAGGWMQVGSAVAVPDEPDWVCTTCSPRPEKFTLFVSDEGIPGVGVLQGSNPWSGYIEGPVAEGAQNVVFDGHGDAQDIWRQCCRKGTVTTRFYYRLTCAHGTQYGVPGRFFAMGKHWYQCVNQNFAAPPVNATPCAERGDDRAYARIGQRRVITPGGLDQPDPGQQVYDSVPAPDAIGGGGTGYWPSDDMPFVPDGDPIDITFHFSQPATGRMAPEALQPAHVTQ